VAGNMEGCYLIPGKKAKEKLLNEKLSKGT
jgi:hypothetical protein